MNSKLRIIAFCCNWCSYAAADLAGISRLAYPPSVRIIRVMCSGMVHPEMVVHALGRGALADRPQCAQRDGGRLRALAAAIVD